jgi:hypothetical protein
VLPGGRNFGQKAQKGPGKKNFAGEFVADFWPNITKSGRKRTKFKFYKEVLYSTEITKTQRQRHDLIFISITLGLNAALMFFVKLAELFLKLAELF